MKKLLVLLISLASVSAFSQVIYLDQTDIRLGGNTATLVKTLNSPSNITLRLSVPTTIERCEPGDYITVTDGARCGYDEVPRRCGGYYGGSHRRGPNYRPPHRRGPNYRPPRGGSTRPRRGTSIYAGRRYNPARSGGYYGGSYGSTYCGYDQVARTCSVCSRPYYETVNMDKTFNLTFSRFPREATIEFSLDQYGNLVLDVTGVSPSCVKKTIYGEGKNLTGAKLKLRRRCR